MTPDELEKRIKDLEAQLLTGGVTTPRVYEDYLGIPKVAEPSVYAPTPLPLIAAGGGVRNTLANELIELKTMQQELQYKTLDIPVNLEQLREENKKDVYNKFITPPFKQTGPGVETEEKKKKNPIFQVFDATPAPIVEIPPQEEVGFGTAISPQQRITKAPEGVVNLKSIQDLLESKGLTPDEANAQAKGVLAAYERKKFEYTDKVRRDPKEPALDFSEILAETLKEIGQLNEAKQLKIDDINAYEKGEFYKGGSEDPYIRAYQKQVSEGGFVPDLSPVQQAFLKASLEEKRKVYGEKNKIEIINKPIEWLNIPVGADSFITVPQEVAQYIASTNRTTTAPFYSEKEDNLIRDNIAAATSGEKQNIYNFPNRPQKLKDADADAIARIETLKREGFSGSEWWLDEAKKKDVIKKPKEFIDRGFFQDVSPFGGTAETTEAWLMRAALTPFNALAGFVGEITAGEDLENQRRQYRAKNQPLYKESPVLANIALNKGFTGQAVEDADKLGLEGWQKWTTIGGGFITDFLDPTFGLAAATGKMSKNAAKLYKAQKRLNQSTSPLEIAKILSKSGAQEFLNDFNGISLVLNRVPSLKKFAKNPVHANVTFHMADRLSDSMGAERAAREVLQSGEATSEKVMKTIERRGHGNSDYARFLRKKLDEGEKIKDAKVIADDASLPKTGDDYGKSLLEINQKRKATQAAIDDSLKVVTIEGRAAPALTRTEIKAKYPKADFKLIDDILLSRHGKKLEDFVGADLDTVISMERGLKGVLDQIYAREIVFDFLPDMRGIEEAVSITRSTWAHSERIPEILAQSNKTDLAKELNQISTNRTGVDLPQAPRQRGTQAEVFEPEIGGFAEPLARRAYFEVLDADKANLSASIVTRLESGSIPASRAAAIEQSIQQNKLYFDDYNYLREINIDETAKSLKSQTGVLTKEDIDKLSPKIKAQFLEAEGVRGTGFVGEKVVPLLKAGWEFTAAKILRLEIPKETLKAPPQSAETIAQSRIYDEVKKEASTMDLALRRDMKSLMKDKATRELYGLDPDRVPTKQEALGALIVGPKGGTRLDVQKAIDDLAETKAKRKKIEEGYDQRAKEGLERLEALKLTLDKLKKEAKAEGRKKVSLGEEEKKELAEFEKIMAEVQNEAKRDQLAELQQEVNRLNNLEKQGILTKEEYFERFESLSDEVDKLERIANLSKEDIKNSIKKRENKLLKQRKKKQTEEIEERIILLEERYNQMKAGIEKYVIGPKPEAVRPKPLKSLSPSEAFSLSNLQDMASWSLNRLFFVSEAKPTFFGKLSGNAQLYSNDLLNARGLDELEDVASEFALRAYQQPQTFWNQYVKLLSDYEAILAKPGNLKPGVTSDLIQDRFARIKDDLRDRVSLAMYYYSEGSRIINKKVLEGISEGTFAVEPKYFVGERRYNDLTKNMQEDMMEAYGYTSPNDMIFDDVKSHISQYFNSGKQVSQRFAVQKYLQATQPGSMLDEIIFANSDSKFNKAMEKYSKRVFFTQTLSDASEYASGIQNMAEQVIRKNNLEIKLNNNMDDVDEVLNALLDPSKERMSRIILGEDVYDELKKQVTSGRIGPLTAELDKLVQGEGIGAFRQLSKFMNGLMSIFYTSVLSLRVQFHVNNIMTAPFIYHTTIGKRAGIKNTGKGVRAMMASGPKSRDYFKIAATSPDGRVYTYGEIYEGVQRGGARTEMSFLQSAINDEAIIKFIEDNNLMDGEWLRNFFRKLRRAPRGAKAGLDELMIKEDMTFRASNMIKALEEGRSFYEAQNIARRSMFDYGDMSQQERAATSTFLVFWAFQRQNLGTFVRALGDARKLKRFYNILKLDRGVEAVQFDLNDKKNFAKNVFFPDYVYNKTIMYRKEDKSEDYDYYMTSPAIPALDAFMVMSQILSAPLTDAIPSVVGGATNPLGRRLLGFKTPFEQMKRQSIPAEQLEIAKLFSGYTDDPYEVGAMFNMITGSPVQPIVADELTGVKIGDGYYKFPMDAEQQRKYSEFMEWVASTGVLAFSQDWLKVFTETSYGYRGSSFLERAAGKPLRMAEPRRQEMFNLLNRKKLLEEEIKRKKSEISKQRQQAKEK